MQHAHARIYAQVCVGISVLIFMSAAFGLLLLLYLNGAISPPLAVVFLPLWLVAAGAKPCPSPGPAT